MTIDIHIKNSIFNWRRKMKITYVILAAMLLCIASVPVMAENIYIDNNPSLSLPSPSSYGYVVFNIRAGGSAQDLAVWVSRDDLKTKLFDPAFHMDRSVIANQNLDYLKVMVEPDGLSNPMLLSSGKYTARIQNGNGNQIEEQHFSIGGGATEYVTFIGAAVQSVPTYCWKIIIIDVPGIEIYHPEVNHTVYHEPATHVVTIVDKEAYDEIVIDVPAYDEVIVDTPAWTETIHHDATTHVVHHDAVTHVVHHNAVTHKVHHPAIPAVPGHDAYYTVVKVQNGHGNCERVSSGSFDFKVDGQKYRIATHGDYCYTHHEAVPTVPAIPAWDETIVDIPAYDEVVTDVAAWDEVVTDSVAYDEIVNHPEVTHTIHHDAITNTVHHDAITHEETITDKEGWTEIVIDDEAYTEYIGAKTHEEMRCGHTKYVEG
jgi:hypothetical protein